MKAEIIEQNPQYRGPLLFINHDKTIVIIGKKNDDDKYIEGFIIFSNEPKYEVGSSYLNFNANDFEIFIGKITLSNI